MQIDTESESVANDFFRFNDLPLELQHNIFRSCLNGWSAALEVHENPVKRKTKCRIWSSHVYDGLMLSLTCKHFHSMIQLMQRDPRLYSGELDLVQENGDLTGLVGGPGCVMFRTQVFIKSNPYGSTRDAVREARREAFHSEVRAWLMTYTRVLSMSSDEVSLYGHRSIRDRTSLSKFKNLTCIQLYWPVRYDPWGQYQFLCHKNRKELSEHFREHVDNVFDDSYNYEEEEDDDDTPWFSEYCSHMAKKGISVVSIHDTEHNHNLSANPASQSALPGIHLPQSSVTGYVLDNSPTLRIVGKFVKNSWVLESVMCLGSYSRPGQLNDTMTTIM